MKASTAIAVYQWLDSIAPDCECDRLAGVAKNIFGDFSWHCVPVNGRMQFTCNFDKQGVSGFSFDPNDALIMAVSKLISAPSVTKVTKKKKVARKRAVKPTGRVACSSSRVTPKELLKKFEAEWDNGVDSHMFHVLGRKALKDINKVQFDLENWEYTGGRKSFLGAKKMTDWQGKEFSYIGWCAGGDWEPPVYFMFYLEENEKTWRGYIPKEGNTWNYKTKQALGNDEDADDKFLRSWLKANDKDLLDSFDDVLLSHENVDIENKKLMVEHISKRFEVRRYKWA